MSVPNPEIIQTDQESYRLVGYFQDELTFRLSAMTDQTVLDHETVEKMVLAEADQLIDDLSVERAESIVLWLAWFSRFNASKMSAHDQFWVHNTAYNIGNDYGAGLDEAKRVWAKVNGTDELPWPQE